MAHLRPAHNARQQLLKHELVISPAPAQRSLIQPEVAPKPGAPRRSGKTYALLVGISRYKQDPPVTSLQFADKDAEMFG
jgi:hypothetical protein